MVLEEISKNIKEVYMTNLEQIGLKEYYCLDGDRIYNNKTGRYLKQVAEYRYRVKAKNGDLTSVTMKWIYRALWNKNFCIDEVELLEGELFKELDGSNGNYEISNYGRVKSLVQNHAMIMKTHLNPNGYERVQLVIDGKKSNRLIHRLVAQTWLERPKNLEQEIHHKDFNKRNNNSDNLMYMSKEEHIQIHRERRMNEEVRYSTKSKNANDK